MHPFTVLLLLPDDMWDGSPADWVRSVWVKAPTASQAVAFARAELVISTHEPLNVDELALITIYEGHLTTLDLEVAA